MLGSRPLSILAILAVLAVGIAFWLTSSRAPSDDMTASGPLMPALSARINDVDEVAISAGGQRIVTLKKRADGWVMPERDDFAVDLGQLRSLLVKLDGARRIEAKTRNPEHYAKLGVGDPASDASATGVRLDIKAGNDDLGVIIGNSRQGGSGTYVRLVDQAQSWLIDRNIAVEKRPAFWLRRQLIDIPASRIQSATVTHPADGDAKADEVVIQADGKTGFKLVNLPQGRELADSYATEALAGFLADLRFSELRAAGDADEPDSGVGNAEFHSRDGIVVSLRYWVEGDQPQRVWASFSVDLDQEQMQKGIDAAQADAKAEYDAARVKANEAAKEQAAKEQAAKDEEDVASASDADHAAGDADESSADVAATEQPQPPLAVTDAAADRQARIAAIRAEFDAIRGRVDGRVFELPTFKASNLRKRLDDYLKPADQ